MVRIEIPEPLHEQLCALAGQRGLPVCEVIRELVSQQASASVSPLRAARSVGQEGRDFSTPRP